MQRRQRTKQAGPKANLKAEELIARLQALHLDSGVQQAAEATGTHDKAEQASVRVDNKAPVVRIQRRRMTQAEREYIWAQTAGKCYICREELPKHSRWHVEHVLAFSLDAKQNDVLGNMLASCVTCNHKKLDKPLEELVYSFACDLDTAAADASHLNSAARACLLSALRVKRSLFEANREAVRDDAARLDPSLLDALEETVERSAQQLLPSGEFNLDEDQRTAIGAFGEVFRATWKRGGRGTPLDVAVKFSRADAGEAGLLRAELDALRALALGGEHRHVVRFYGLLQWDDACGLVFEWCDFDLSKRPVMRHGDLPGLVAQAADALAWLHGRAYLHRDIKPMNVLVWHTEGSDWETAEVRLADFGLTKRILRMGGEEEHTHHVGTAYFRAPEARSGKYYPQTDVYSLGKSMQFLRSQRISALFKSPSLALRVWEEIEAECISDGQPHTARPSAAQVRDRLRGARRESPPPAAAGTADTGSASEGLVVGESQATDTVAGAKDADATSAAAAAAELVYVSKNARTADGEPYKQEGRKYHARAGCYQSWKMISLETARRFGHTECSRCYS